MLQRISEELISDNAPEYSSYMFQAFAREFGIKYIKSSLRYSWNLTSEKDCPNNRQDPYLALLELRDTPLPGEGLSLVQLLMVGEPDHSS